MDKSKKDHDLKMIMEGKIWDKVKKVWRDHKGKIITGAAVAGTALAAYGGVKGKQKYDKNKANEKTWKQNAKYNSAQYSKSDAATAKRDLDMRQGFLDKAKNREKKLDNEMSRRSQMNTLNKRAKKDGTYVKPAYKPFDKTPDVQGGAYSNPNDKKVPEKKRSTKILKKPQKKFAINMDKASNKDYQNKTKLKIYDANKIYNKKQSKALNDKDKLTNKQKAKLKQESYINNLIDHVLKK